MGVRFRLRCDSLLPDSYVDLHQPCLMVLFTGLVNGLVMAPKINI
jgi:hypothetical protein